MRQDTTRILLSVLCMVSLAHAEEMQPEAKAHLDRGLALYTEKDYEGAITAFRTGFAIDSRREFLYAWAQAERLSGDCPSAISLYEQFLSTSPPKEQADAAMQNMLRCRQALATQPEPTSQPTVPTPVPRRDEPERVGWESPEPWYGDALGGVLVGTAALGMGATIWLYLDSESHLVAANEATTYPVFSSELDQAESRRLFSYVGAGVSTAFLLTGIGCYLWRDAPQVTLFFDWNSGGLAVKGRF